MSTPTTISSLASDVPASTVPVVNQALEPASVRDGTPAVKQAYANALSFESVLVNELSEQLVQTAGIGSGSTSPSSSSSSGVGGSSGDPTVSDFASMLPGALTSAIMSDGGLGIAAQLLPSLDGSVGATTSSTSTATADAQGGAAAS
jgi:hypothetical protein